jgi:hypothetical protein
MPPGARHHRQSANAFSTRRICFSKRSDKCRRNSAGTGTELLRDLEMIAATVNRAQRRLTGATATELDAQQSKAALYQTHIQKQLVER